MTNILRRIDRVINMTVLFLSELALGAMAVIVILTVVLRYFFNTGLAWAEEVPRLLVGYFAFFGCAMGVRDRDHMAMDAVYTLFPEKGKTRAAIDFFADFCVLLSGLFMLYYGGLRVLKMMNLPGVMPITRWPNWVRYGAVPIAGLVIVYDSILFLTKVIKPGDTLFADADEQDPVLLDGPKGGD